MKVYQCISSVAAHIAEQGIAKSRQNTQQGYAFRGIDDVYNALTAALTQHGLVMLPRVLSRSVAERVTAKGGAIFYVTVEVEYDLIAVEDGSTHTIKTFGEAMDSADKATNKAMSAAYKYAALQAFCIPTEGEPESDADSPPETMPETVAEEMIRVATGVAAEIRKAASKQAADFWMAQGEKIPNLSAQALSRLRAIYAERIEGGLDVPA